MARPIYVDVRVATFTAAITLLTGVLFGLAPAAQVRGDSIDTLRDGGRHPHTAGHALHDGRLSSRKSHSP